jgi:hypothetical protein
MGPVSVPDKRVTGEVDTGAPDPSHGRIECLREVPARYVHPETGDRHVRYLHRDYAAVVARGDNVVHWKGAIAYNFNFRAWAIVFGMMWFISFIIAWRIVIQQTLKAFKSDKRRRNRKVLLHLR